MATPNMSLVEIVPGVTTGPQYATDIVSNFSTIDSHDHTTGRGVQIPTSGLNINADLDFGGNSPTGLGKSQYNSLGAALSGASNYRSVHVVSGELYYLDGSGNAVQLTSGGSVAGSAGNITGLSSPASVTFSTNKYVFKDTANSFAIMESADVRLFEDSASAISNYVAIRSPGSLASTYTMTMPSALPATSLEYLSMTSAGVVEPKTSNEVVETVSRSTGTTVGSLGVAISASSGSYLTTSSTRVDVTNLSVTITTSGRPIVAIIEPAGATTLTGAIGVVGSSATLADGNITLVRDSTPVKNGYIVAQDIGGGQPQAIRVPSMTFTDTPSAGTYTYKIQADTGAAAGNTIVVEDCHLVVYEL